MATTTNYSWTTPDDTALVKDGAAAIRSLGTAIDSTVFTNAGAAVAKATVDAKGDLIAGTADNTVDRLAVGANDTVLTADSSTATGLKWAAPAGGGGMTLISTATPSGATTVSFTSIATSYKELVLVWSDCQSSTFSTYWSMTLNNDTSGNYYGRGIGNGAGGGIETTNFNGHTAFGNAANNAIIGYTGSGSIQAAQGYCRIFNANEAAFHTVSYTGSGRGADTPIIINGLYADATAITRIDLIRSSSQTLTGTIRLYGLS
jgi:hypothetical protein